MSLIVTYMLTCDSCSQMIETRAQECKESIAIPERPTMLGMDLCQSCREKATFAVRDALGIPGPTQPRMLN